MKSYGLSLNYQTGSAVNPLLLKHVPREVLELRASVREGEWRLGAGEVLVEFAYPWTDGSYESEMGIGFVGLDSPDDLPSKGEVIRLNGVEFTVVQEDDKPDIAEVGYEFHTVLVRLAQLEEA